MSLGNEGVGLLPRINRSHKRAYVFFPNLVQAVKFPISKATVVLFPNLVQAVKFPISKATAVLFPTLISSNKTVTKTTGVTII